MSDWQTRTRPEIKLTSPEGNVFTCLWQKNAKRAEKKLGIFNYPKFNGTGVQDLGTTGKTYPMILFFTGPNHDLEVQRFEDAMSESGAWTVIHPVDGKILLQPVSWTINQDVIETASYTAVDTEWIVPASQEAAISVTEMQSKISRQKIEVNIQASNQFQSVTQNSAAEKIAVSNTMDKSIIAFDKNIGNIYNASSAIAGKVKKIKNSIQDTIGAAVINTISMAGQIKELLQTPALAVRDASAKVEAYRGMANEILGISPDNTHPEDKNTALTQEAVLTSLLGAIADTVTTGEYDTKSQAIQLIDDITSLFDLVIDGLDDIMNNFSGSDFNLQYFSQSESFGAAVTLLARIIAYLMRVSFNLKTEKKIKLTASMTSMQIVIDQYGELGEDDILLDSFIYANQLKGNDILYLPAGREVTVYV